ncbi:MAG: hypothetical protein GWN00_01195 [Aliifodinibius sp.]|nr:FAD-dependent thymidylate synthase [Fodinibius sp.]NIV09947.1 hypothetical protein [Fodinibius sp.]NIY23477.1 hypothetical protein [Fodinibius sp.]
MELVDQKFKVLGPAPVDPEEALKWVEVAGRYCYNSLGKIKPGSAEKFFEQLFKQNPPHVSVMEHSCICYKGLYTPGTAPIVDRIKESKYLFYHIGPDRTLYLYGNWRAWAEWYKTQCPRRVIHNWYSLYTELDEMLPMFSRVTDQLRLPREARMISVQVTTDRAILAEVARHRPFGFSVQSQRYVGYDNIRFVKPAWFDKASKKARELFITDCKKTEDTYRKFRVDFGMPPQDARVCLTNQTATELTLSGFPKNWEWLFYLRTASGAYPQFIKLATPMEKEFQQSPWW